MNTQKGFASILLVLLGIIFIGGGIYFYKNFSKKTEQIVNEDQIELATTTFKQVKSVSKENNLEIKNNTATTTEKVYRTYDKLDDSEDFFDIKSIKALGSGSDKYEVEIEIVEGYWEEGMPNPGLKLTNRFKTILISENIEVDLQTWQGADEDKWFSTVYFYEFAKMFNELKKDEKRCNFFGATVTYGTVDKMGFFCGV